MRQAKQSATYQLTKVEVVDDFGDIISTLQDIYLSRRGPRAVRVVLRHHPERWPQTLVGGEHDRRHLLIGETGPKSDHPANERHALRGEISRKYILTACVFDRPIKWVITPA